MDLHAFLRSRRSIRRFNTDHVSTAVIERMIETATFAPSAHNRQPWRFAIVTETSIKSQLSEAMAVAFRRDLEKDGVPPAEVKGRMEKSSSRINSAPVVVVLCMDVSEMDVYQDRI